jgi:hypothetical protein
MLYTRNAAGNAARGRANRPHLEFLRLTGVRNWKPFGPMARPGHSCASLLSRATAVFAIGLVLALLVFASSPQLHGWLHGHEMGALGAAHNSGNPASHPSDADDDDSGCVVTLFAQGLVLALASVALFFTGPAPSVANVGPFKRILPEAPRYLLLPTQAPPRA